MGVFEESVGAFLTPIQKHLDDEAVTEVLVNGPGEVFVEKAGLLYKVTETFRDDQALMAAIRNIAQFVGRKIDTENPILDARLPSGHRVAAVIPPCSKKGATLSIRKFSKSTPTFKDLITRGSITRDAAVFLDVCIFLAKNIVISGGTGSGKTTLLNVMGSRIPGNQRLLIIEDTAELKISTPHVVFLEAKHPDGMGKGEVTIRDLIRSSLRLRPDRIVVGEVRGPEALDLVTAMNTGHGGSMGTTHANTPYDALVRLETLSMMGDANVPVAAIRRQIAAAINLVVQIRRMNDGSRKITSIAEVVPEVDEHGRYLIKEVFAWVQRGRTPEGKLIGEMVATGYIPSFMAEIELNKLPFTRAQFAAPDWFQKMSKLQAA